MHMGFCRGTPYRCISTFFQKSCMTFAECVPYNHRENNVHFCFSGVLFFRCTVRSILSNGPVGAHSVCSAATGPNSQFLQTHSQWFRSSAPLYISVAAKARWFNFFCLRLFDFWCSWIFFWEVSQWYSAWESWCGVMRKALFGSTVPRQLC